MGTSVSPWSEELLAELGGGGGGNAMLTAAKKKQRDGPGGGGVHGGACLLASIEPVHPHALAASCAFVPHCLLAVYSCTVYLYSLAAGGSMLQAGSAQGLTGST
jgi:hypothetical protein